MSIYFRIMHPNMNKGETGKVESSKEGEEWSVEDSHHCVAAREGALNKKTFISTCANEESREQKNVQ